MDQKKKPEKSADSSFFSFLGETSREKSPENNDTRTKKINDSRDVIAPLVNIASKDENLIDPVQVKKKEKRSFFSFFRKKQSKVADDPFKVLGDPPKSPPARPTERVSHEETPENASFSSPAHSSSYESESDILPKAGIKIKSVDSEKPVPSVLKDKGHLPSPESILDSIVSRSGSDGERRLVLGPKPAAKPEIGIRYGVEKKLRSAKFAFRTTLGIFLLLIGFFTVQLDRDFDLPEKLAGYRTVARENVFLRDEVKRMKTDINLKKYLLVKYYLDTFIFLADGYQYGSSSDFTGKRSDVLTDIEIILSKVRDILNDPLYPKSLKNPYLLVDEGDETYFAASQEADRAWASEYQTALFDLVNSKKAGYKTSLDGDEARQKIEVLNGIPSLLSKQSFLKKSINDVDTENLGRSTIKTVMEKLNLVSKNNFSIVTNIKDQRINWTENLRHIDDITKKVDIYYGVSDVDDYRRVVYDSYKFDADNNTVTVSGELQSDDARVFSEVLDLVEEFEKSQYFELRNDFRKFSKSQKDKKYVSKIQLVLEIVPPEETSAVLSSVVPPSVSPDFPSSVTE